MKNERTTKTGAFTFHEVLPRLVASYESGRLVPFIGTGMSAPACRGWEQLVINLEAAAGPTSTSATIAGARQQATTAKARPEELIRRVNAATRRLRSGAKGAFERAFEQALFDPARSRDVPPQTTALAKIWWPLVLTTNYDNFYVEAFSQASGSDGLRVVGRGPEDCQRVLTSLSTAGRAVLWTLQGHVTKPCVPQGHHTEDSRLAKEIVLDHAEYRRVTHREPHFRRAFAEVFRQRSFFFLGAGIAEPYFQELFGEILEFYGPSSRTHYAIMPEGEVDPRFMYARFQIAVVEFPAGHYEQVPAYLEDLAKELERRATVPNGWSWGSASILGEDLARAGATSHAANLEVRFGALPDVRTDRECLAVSAGGRPSQPAFFLSQKIYATIGGWGVPVDTRLLQVPREAGIRTEPAVLHTRYVGEYAGHDVFAVRARNEDDEKDLSEVAPAATALFDAVAGRYSRIHMQLLASGGSGSEGAAWSRRPFPARFTFIEIVRAWAAWKRCHLEDPLSLTLHIIEPGISREIASGRIDVSELLLAEDLRFWAEIVERDGSLERRVFHKPPTATLADVIDELGLSSDFWTLDVSPPASLEDPLAAPAAVSERLTKTLRELRVVPGGTLHFHRSQD